MKGGEEVEWWEVLGMILGLLLTLAKIVDIILNIILKIKKLITDDDSDEQN